MTMGVAGALLVFAGLWRATEWAMSERNRDTARLVPVGLVYLVLGCLIVTLQYLPWVAWAALPVVAASLATAAAMRHRSGIRRWVAWAFVAIDAAIIVSLLTALLT